MQTIYRLDGEGGFTVADTDPGGCTAYAAPGSANAALAAIGRVEIAAERMMAMEELRRWHHHSQDDTPECRARDAANMQRLQEGRADGSTRAASLDSRSAEVSEGRSEARYHAGERIDAIRESFSGYDPNAPGSALIERRFDEQHQAAQPVAPAPEMTAKSVNIMFDVQDRSRDGAATEFDRRDAAHIRASGYAGYEIAQVVEYAPEDGDTKTHCERWQGTQEELEAVRLVGDDYLSDFWTVYGRDAQTGEAEALCDFPTQDKARNFLAEITGDRYADRAWTAKEANRADALEPGLPQIGAAAPQQPEEPRRRANDKEQPGPRSDIEGNMIQGLGRKIEREQREIYHSEGMDKTAKSDALDANLARNIEAWDRPAVTAAKALDAGRVKPTTPLFERIQAGMTPEEKAAVDKIRGDLAQRRGRSTGRDDYSISG